MMVNQDTANQLRKLDWFDNLPDEMLTTLAQKVQKRKLNTNEILFNKGEEGDSLFVINSGWVKIVTEDSQGSEVILNQLGAGEVIGEMALLDNEPRSAGVIALSKTTVLELKRDDFMEILKRQPDIALSVIRNFSSRMRYNTNYIEKITEMSKLVAHGDYSFIDISRPANDLEASAGDQDQKIGQLLAEFFAMTRGVKEREDNLKKQVEKLTIQIDQERRKKEFEAITNTEFYSKLKMQAKALRAQRTDNKQ
jgi:CRP-like cAMP-binding protein